MPAVLTGGPGNDRLSGGRSAVFRGGPGDTPDGIPFPDSHVDKQQSQRVLLLVVHGEHVASRHPDTRVRRETKLLSALIDRGAEREGGSRRVSMIVYVEIISV
jgi:hypothetical protein